MSAPVNEISRLVSDEAEKAWLTSLPAVVLTHLTVPPRVFQLQWHWETPTG